MQSASPAGESKGLPDNFTADLGQRHYFDGDTSVFEFDAYDCLLTPDRRAFRAGALAALADVASGSLAGRIATPSVPLTVDLSVKRTALSAPRQVIATARPVKIGRSLIVLETEFRSTFQMVAYSMTTFIRLPRPHELALAPVDDFSARRVMSEPMPDCLGLKVLDGGVVEMQCRDYVLQLTGTVHGGALALVAELAAESATGSTVLDLDMHYLSSVQLGPVRSSTREIDRGLLKVEIVDVGANQRRVAVATARCET